MYTSDNSIPCLLLELSTTYTGIKSVLTLPHQLI